MNPVRFTLITLGISLAALAAPKEEKKVAAADIKWQDLDPKHPGGPQMVVVSGDPKKGPVEFILKVPPGTDAGLHSHTSDYTAVLISGGHNHYKESPADGQPMTPGSYWFQPGKQVHGDICTGTADCILVISMPGKFDMIPAKGAMPAKDKPADKPAEKPAEPAKK